jgi:hypothetical protein
MSELTSEVRFYPAIDTRGQPGGGSLECMRLIFALKGAAGAITWSVLTRWVPPESHELDELLLNLPLTRGIKEHDVTHALCRPLPVSVDIHRPAREGEEPGVCHVCHLVAGGKCVVDCGSLAHGIAVWRVFLQQGDAAVWRELEARYHQALEGTNL